MNDFSDSFLVGWSFFLGSSIFIKSGSDEIWETGNERFYEQFHIWPDEFAANR